MITQDGWLSWADRVPGPLEKVYSQLNTAEGYIPHSMVGKLAGWYSRLFDMTRDIDGRFTANAAASVHGSILTNGHTIQHYPFTASCWASGSRKANTTRIAFENESEYTNGRPDETIPFTEPQLLSNVRVIEELAAWKGWVPARPPSTVLVPATLLEHTEAVRIWGGHATACPSNRAEWEKILYLLKMEDDMTTYKLLQQWAPAMTWLLAYVEGVPIYKRHLAFAETVSHLASKLGTPETIGKEQLKWIPKIDL